MSVQYAKMLKVPNLAIYVDSIINYFIILLFAKLQLNRIKLSV